MWQSKAMAVVALSALAVSTQAVADSDRPLGDGYYVNARVVRVEPIVHTVRVATPQKVCWNEKVRRVRHRRSHHHSRHHHQSAMPVIVGGVVGGVVGNQIGRNGDRGALTIAGTLIGAAVGHGIHNTSHHHHRPRRSHTVVERHCEVETRYHSEERIEGYDVTYRYQGRRFTTRMDHDPGNRIRVWVQVEPTSAYERVGRTGQPYLSHGRICDDDCLDS